MKRIFLSFAVFTAISFLLINVSFANTQIIEKFEVIVENNSDVVNIEWRTSSETNVTRFEVQRQSGSDFKTIFTQIAKGKPSTYRFTDKESFTKENTSDSFQSTTEETYRIKIVFSNSQVTYSDKISVNRRFNNIKRTLGMLKELFK